MVDFITPIVVVAVLVALVAVTNVWIIGSADRSFFELMVKMPKFVDRPDATLEDYEASGGGQGMMETYHHLRLVSVFVMAGAFILGMMLFLGEEFGVKRKGQALELVANTLVYSLFLVVFPVLWDGVATGVEYLNVYILNPADPTPENAAARAKDLFIKLGGINTEFDIGKLIEGTAKALVGDQAGLTQFFHDVVTAVFRAFLAALVFLMMFVVGTMRIVLTAAIIVGLPMILAIKLVPWVCKPADRLLETLYGLVVATTISSIVVVAGTAYLDTLSKDGVVENLQAFIAAAAVIILAVFMPVMLSPMLGSVVSSVTGMVTSSLAAGMVAGGSAITGAARGAARALGHGGVAFGGTGGGPGTGLGLRIAQNAVHGIGGTRTAKVAQDVPEEKQGPVSQPYSEVTGASGAQNAKDAHLEPSQHAARPVIETGLPKDTGAGDKLAGAFGVSGDVYAVPVQTCSGVFAPEPAPLLAVNRLRAGAKGAIVGAVAGLAQGLGVGLAIESRGAGMSDIGRAMTDAFGGRLAGPDRYLELGGVRKAFVLQEHEAYVSEAGQQRDPIQDLIGRTRRGFV